MPRCQTANTPLPPALPAFLLGRTMAYCGLKSRHTRCSLHITYPICFGLPVMFAALHVHPTNIQWFPSYLFYGSSPPSRRGSINRSFISPRLRLLHRHFYYYYHHPGGRYSTSSLSRLCPVSRIHRSSFNHEPSRHDAIPASLRLGQFLLRVPAAHPGTHLPTTQRKRRAHPLDPGGGAGGGRRRQAAAEHRGERAVPDQEEAAGPGDREGGEGNGGSR
jgi:hypothetical protein